jgi:enoyl-CoA hydratase
MDYKNLIVEIDQDIAFVSINRPEKGNSLSDLTVSELLDFFSQKPSAVGARAAIIGGVGEKFFCAGSDIGDLMKKDVEEQSEGFSELALMFEAIRKSQIISIASVQGLALGGGFGLTASCDIAIASRSARFGLPEINLGIAPMIVLLPVMRAIGMKQAFLLSSRGNIIAADEALRIGLISAIVEKDELDNEAKKIAIELVEKSGIALELIKKGLQRVEDYNYVKAYEYLQDVIKFSMTTKDAKEGLSAFTEKRPPKWKHQ